MTKSKESSKYNNNEINQSILTQDLHLASKDICKNKALTQLCALSTRAFNKQTRTLIGKKRSDDPKNRRFLVDMAIPNVIKICFGTKLRKFLNVGGQAQSTFKSMLATHYSW